MRDDHRGQGESGRREDKAWLRRLAGSALGRKVKTAYAMVREMSASSEMFTIRSGVPASERLNPVRSDRAAGHGCHASRFHRRCPSRWPPRYRAAGGDVLLSTSNTCRRAFAGDCRKEVQVTPCPVRCNRDWTNGARDLWLMSQLVPREKELAITGGASEQLRGVSTPVPLAECRLAGSVSQQGSRRVAGSQWRIELTIRAFPFFRAFRSSQGVIALPKSRAFLTARRANTRCRRYWRCVAPKAFLRPRIPVDRLRPVVSRTSRNGHSNTGAISAKRTARMGRAVANTISKNVPKGARAAGGLTSARDHRGAETAANNPSRR